MACEICNVDLVDDDRRYAAPCCDRVFHSQCVMDMVGRFVDALYDINTPELACLCGHVHWMRPPTATVYEAEKTNLDARLKDNATMRADLRKVRAKIRASGGAVRAFDAVLKSEHEHFMNGAQIHINALKALQEASRTRLRLSAECLASRKALASASASRAFFTRRYNIGWRESRILFKTSGRRYRRRRGELPSQIIRWKFMLRIW